MYQVTPAFERLARSAPAEAKIRLLGTGKKFQVRGTEIEALRPVDLEVGREEFVALVGPSGCGK